VRINQIRYYYHTGEDINIGNHMRALNQFVVNAGTFFIIAAIAIFSVSCEERENPPFFTAKVIDRFGQATAVGNFKILYTWEERGETPFLKPYAYHTKEVVVEIMQPVPGEARRVNIVTRKILLQDIQTFEFIPGEAGNSIRIQLKNNEQIVATDRFPQIFKKGENTGLADYKIYVAGITVNNSKQEEFKLAWDMVKQFEITKIAATP
jgi:hypothetical protein